MSKSLSLLPGVVVALALVGCGTSTTDTKKVVPEDLCERFQIDCQDETGLVSCDPADGQCKCGGALGNGVVCAAGEECILGEGASFPSCVSLLCADARCGRGEACDPLDGLCKCGGEVCAPGTACVDGSCEDNGLCADVACREGETCDPADGICKCGEGLCSQGQTCRAGADGVGACVGELCVGKNCPDGTTCSTLDGLCHCGTVDGPVCSSGQSCVVEVVEGEDGQEVVTGRCEGTHICEGVICHGGTTCSPLDGKCRCGGYDTQAPECSEGQSCDQRNRQCLGGDKCAEVFCDPDSNTSCDDEYGICKCGGTNGVVCDEEEGCVAGLDGPLCVTKCNPLASNVESDVCGNTSDTPQTCYYSARDHLAFCAPPGDGSENTECLDWSDCGRLSHCVAGTDDKGVCRRYCDTIKNDCHDEGKVCVPLAGSSDVVPNLGTCRPVI